MVGFFLFTTLLLLVTDGCSSLPEQREAEQQSLTIMSLVDKVNAEFENKVLSSFLAKDGYRLRYIPEFESDDARLAILQKLIRARSPQPDLLEVDIIWPSLLENGLLDLKPYLGSDLASYPPELLQAFTVKGRLVALPIYMDSGLLYYRIDLLKKYGFPHPPETWDELEKMAKAIQTGERNAGKKNFWGYVWQGQAAEGLTCNALEWQISQGGGPLLNEDRTVSVCNRNAIHALKRAVSWIGTISPPGVTSYGEEDSLNVWQSGNAAFVRSWIYLYGSARQPSSPVRNQVGVAMMPGGSGGKVRILGNIAIGVSTYSTNRNAAIAAVRQLTSAKIQSLRTQQIGTVPTRSLLQQDQALMQNTPFHGPLAGQVMTDVVTRPSLLAGKSYDRVSRAYFEAVHSALTRQTTPEQALAKLQTELVQITGFRPIHQN